MDLTPQPSVTEVLANLSVMTILEVVTVLTVIRLALVKIQSPAARSWAEIFESAMIAIVLVYLIIRPFVLQAYFIPSPSMEPTLLGNNNVGDRILVNKFTYRFQNPRDEDVVVFLAPKEAMAGNPDFIKRLMGSPSDTVSVVGGHVIINGAAYDHEQVREALARAGNFGPDAEISGTADQADHHVKFVTGGVLADNSFVPADQLGSIVAGLTRAQVTVEPGYVIRNGRRLTENYTAEDPDYDMKIVDGEPLKHDFGEVGFAQEFTHASDCLSEQDYDAYANRATEPIPAGKYLMMGDNRNDSKDGTCWGLLDSNRIVGRAVFIFWPIRRTGAIR